MLGILNRCFKKRYNSVYILAHPFYDEKKYDSNQMLNIWENSIHAAASNSNSFGIMCIEDVASNSIGAYLAKKEKSLSYNKKKIIDVFLDSFEEDRRGFVFCKKLKF